MAIVYLTGHLLGLVDEILETVEHSSSCSTGAPVDTTLVDGLSC